MADDFDMPMPIYRVPRGRGGLDGGTLRLLLIAGGLGGALLLVLGLSLVGGHHRGTVPVIEADSTPIRVKPDNPGGLAVAGQDDEAFSSTGAADAGKLAPAAEVPALQALHAQERQEERAEERHSANASRPPRVAAAPPPQPVSLPAQDPPAAPRSAPAPVAGHTATEAGPAAGHAAQVQLGALLSEAAAQEEWARLNRKAPDLLAAHRPEVSPMEHDGHKLWRLRTGGFADIAEATLFCQHARAKGMPCAIVAF